MSNKSRCPKCNHPKGERKQATGKDGTTKKNMCGCDCHNKGEK